MQKCTLLHIGDSEYEIYFFDNILDISYYIYYARLTKHIHSKTL